jgi:hypothetical protein
MPHLHPCLLRLCQELAAAAALVVMFGAARLLQAFPYCQLH